ncbi:MAG: SpoIIE family protein phosphatase, partial [Verrucomicrobiae bacterium]|nr:SpoIIE family protein phosphatase [Verrucomicrobiae bacterium]
LTTCLDLARQLGDPLQEARAYTYLSWTQLMMCRPREALEFSTKAIRMLRRLGEYYDLGASLVFRDQANCVITPCKQAIEENRTFLSLAADAHIHQPMSWGQIHGAYLKALQGDFTDETVRSVEEALRICERNNDRPSNLLAHGVLAFGYLRRKDYTRAVAAAEHVLSILGTHEMKACWIKQVWPICAQVYLEALQHGGDANPETRSHLLKRARYFCEEALKRGRHYGYIFGWACQVFGTYWMLRGDAPKARRYWDRGIRFHRENESPFRLACLLKESGRWGLKARSDDRQALERLVEAKDVFTRYDYFNDAAETAALIRGSGASEPAESPRSALTFKRHLESLLSVTQAIGSVFEIEGLLEHILSYAMEVTGAERGCILLNSESSGRLELRTRRGWSAETSAKPFSYEGYGVSLSLVESVRKKQTARVAGTKDDDDVGAELGQYGVRQAMAVPLRTKEKDLGLLYLDNHLADGVFGDDELELMKSFAIQAAVSIENTHLVQSLVEQDRLKQEMKLGQEIQRGFLPKEAPNVRGLKVSAFMQPAREIGGDYYDYIVRPGDNGSSPLAIVIGDVTGKGLGAGLNMAMVKTTLLTLSREPIGVREILIKANRILHGQMSFGTFISLLYLQWDPAARAMTFAGAGHCDLLAVRAASGKVETVRSGGAALGLIPEIEQKVQERELPLAPGDKLVLYTDGVVEAQNAAEEEFGAARLISALEKNARLGPEELLAAVRAELRAFAGDAAQYDDITLIALELDE